MVSEDGGGSFCRADTVAVLAAAPARVPAPCGWARAGGCGGCDLQHVDPAEQRAWKAAVLAEQLRRLAGIERLGTGRGAAGRPAGLASRGCGWPSTPRAGPGCARTAATTCCRSPTARWPRRGCCRRCSGAATTRRRRPRSRWPPTPTAWSTSATTGRSCSGRPVASGCSRPGCSGRSTPRSRTPWPPSCGSGHSAPSGGTVWDLYGGVGLFAAVLAEQVGATGEVTVVESSRPAVADGRAALADLPQVRWCVGRVENVLGSGDPQPPRSTPPRS